MSKAKARRFQPRLDLLDGRQLLSGCVSASLSHGLLTVQGTSAKAPIQVDILAIQGRHGPQGTVIVQGVGKYRASQIQRIMITGVPGENVSVINPRHRWNVPTTVSGLGDITIPGPTPAATVSVPAPPASNAVATTPSPGASSVGTMSALEQAVVDLTNQTRAQYGLPALQVSNQLVTAAAIHSRDMAQLNVLDHDLPGVAQPTLQSRAEAVGYSYSWLGENIAWNYPDARSVLTGWMNSPGHRANILNPNYTQIGVGIAWNSLGQPYYTQEFGRPL
jgi:uncharacterized protein YkwD